ncbi:hypothetical protein ACTFIZ_006712 [Dictyostelium cf. discoideum]
MYMSNEGFHFISSQLIVCLETQRIVDVVIGDSAYSSSYYVTPRSYRSYTEDSTEKSISVYKREHAALRSLVERSFKLVKDHAACSIKQKSKPWFHACVVMTCFYMVNMELSFVD